MRVARARQARRDDRRRPRRQVADGQEVADGPGRRATTGRWAAVVHVLEPAAGAIRPGAASGVTTNDDDWLAGPK